MSTTDTILSTRQAGVAVITLNRPERLNAVTASMGVAFDEAVLAADDDPDVRVIVLTGAGRGFCAGADLEVLAEDAAGDDGLTPDEGMHPELLLQVRKPVIAAVNGATAGLGFSLMLMADLRLVAEDAKLTTSFARLGLVAEYGSAWLLPRIIGVANAFDVLCTGRKFTGVEAVQLGIAQQAFPADEVLPAAVALASTIAASCSPQSLATIKDQVYGDLGRSFPEAYARGAELMTTSFAHPDVNEGITAQAERRAPRFAPLPRRERVLQEPVA